MRSFKILPLLCIACTLLNLVQGLCNLEGRAKVDEDFPDIEQDAIESYQLTVEFTMPEEEQTDYYVEYYDLIDRQGRVETHQEGKSHSYIYRALSSEAWKVTSDECTLMDIMDTPPEMKHDMIDWLYTGNGDTDMWTFGPSAMFKNALSIWKKDIKYRSSVMAYMGESESEIRGLKTQYWRRCTNESDTDESYTDYFFTRTKDKGTLAPEAKGPIPLRVFFGGKRVNMGKETSIQQYDIMTFRSFIKKEEHPFELPKGKGCRRSVDLTDTPKLPSFQDSNLQFSAEVIYRKVDFSGEDVSYWSYYSNLEMAFDVQSDYIAYYYTPWNSTNPEKKKETDDESDDVPTSIEDQDEPSDPLYEIYDSKNGYKFTTNMVTGKCSIARAKKFFPRYKLPGKAGEISLVELILYPNAGMVFLDEGRNRGLKVNVFEEVGDLILTNITDFVSHNAIVTHSYLTKNEIERNSISIKNALVQVQVVLSGREENVKELIAINFYNFDTEIKNRREVFSTQRCFRNDDDYLWVTVGFNADDDKLAIARKNVPNIENNFFNAILSKSELNPARVPVVMVDIKEKLYVTILVLGRPPVLWDFLQPEKDTSLDGVQDVDGIDDIETCATKCLEEESNCWAFSFCGAICSFAGEKAQVVDKKGCSLYRRYDNETFMQSKEMLVQSIRREVESNDFKLVLIAPDVQGGMIQLEPSSIEVKEPGEDDRIINRIGNKPNPRMRILKIGAKLNSKTAEVFKNLGTIGFDECQKECLDYKDCETVSYCVSTQECILSKQFGDDISKDSLADNNLCMVVTRKYSDLFNRSPGNILTITAQEVSNLDTVEKCARACLKSSGYECQSFDHCPQSKESKCMLHTVYYPNENTREAIQIREPTCGHYYRKFSTEFQKTSGIRYYGSSVPIISNGTLEDCAKSCMEFRAGTCYGYDFCQGDSMQNTWCQILDKETSKLERVPTDVCNNFAKKLDSPPVPPPKPYTTGYAGGIGFLCFIVGIVVGALVLFGIAYIRVNRH